MNDTRGAMKIGVVAGEAKRNLLAGVGRSPFFVVGLVCLAIVGVLVPQLALRYAVDRANTYQESGASTLIVRATGQIDGARCEAFVGLPNVVTAGAVRESLGGIRLDVLPSTAVRYYENSPNFANVLQASRSGAGLILSNELADVVGGTPGRSLAVSGSGEIPISGRFAYPNDGRVAGFASSILGEVRAEQGYFDECWIKIWPQDPVITELAAVVVVGLGGGANAAPEQFMVNQTLGKVFSIEAEEAVWRYSSISAGVLAGIATWLHIRGRRLEFASARHIGVRGSDQLATVVIESSVCVLVALSIVSPFAAHLCLGSGESYGAIGWFALRGAVLLLAGAVVGGAIGVLSVRERHLLRYFRERA